MTTTYPGQTQAQVEAPKHLHDQWVEGLIRGKPFEPPFIKLEPTNEDVMAVWSSARVRFTG